MLALASGRRSKLAFLALWLAIAAVAGQFAGKLEGAEKNEPVSFLPGGAESVKALRELKRFPSGEVTPAVAVYRRASGLTAADRARVARDRAALLARPPEGTARIPPPVFSPDRRAALLVVAVRARGKSDVLLHAVDALRARTGHASGGLVARVSGPAGYSADAVKVFRQINGALLGATVALVFVLLILIYRSPIFWIIPLLSVGIAEVASRAVGYGLAEAGVTVNGQSASILPVLVFGAGTDYALLLVARYREELRRHEDRHEAMAFALRRAGPAIVASGLTVIAALLCLSLAEVNGTKGLGPIGAVGIALAMVAMLTLLPALLVVAGRRAFWPYVPRFGAEGVDETHGAWRRAGERIGARPRRVWVAAVAVLAVFAAGVAWLNTDLTRGKSFRGSADSVEGQRLIAASFPAGANAPTTIVVPDAARAPAVGAALRRMPVVASVRPVERGAPGVRLSMVLRDVPYSTAAYAQVPGLRRVARAAGGPGTLVGGPTAEERDLRVAAVHDNRLIVPVVLAVVFLILAVLLRTLVAPLLLIGTVVLSYAAALGIGSFFAMKVFGFAGLEPSLPLFTFVFLVALGVDYNIFLMARVREESLHHGTRQGMLRGLAVTGAVITSAGIVLAGTFSALAVLPLVQTTEIGFTIAVGVLLDTFLVRSILVPALVMDIGPRVWWPSALASQQDRFSGPDRLWSGRRMDTLTSQESR